MEQVIVAFENTKSASRIKEILETSGTASCILCKTADQIRRTVNKIHITAVICGYKLADQTAEALADDLPPSCALLVLAVAAAAPFLLWAAALPLLSALWQAGRLTVGGVAVTAHFHT